MQATIRGAPPPPPQSVMIVYRVTGSESQEFVCVCSAPTGVFVHWHGRRSHECRRETGDCQGCRENWPSKWQGYLHVLSDMGRREGFLEITSTCYHLLQTKMPDKQAWRGMRFRISRTKGGPRGRYLVDVLEARVTSENLIAERDPVPLLRKLWGAKKSSGNGS